MSENSKIERPVIFSGPMVRAVLDDLKTNTRRVMNPQPILKGTAWEWRGLKWTDADRCPAGTFESVLAHCPYGKPGDKLWVRECFDCFAADFSDAQCGITYRADNHSEYVRCLEWPQKVSLTPKWRPAIHMPRWASRILLEIEQVRVERVQEIGEEDALAEGVQVENPQARGYYGPRNAFKHLWDSINGKREGCAWKDNPWVWAISFKRIANPAYPQIQASKAEAGK